MKEIKLFVHIPKTAGSSFRKGFEKSEGLQKVVYDYSEHSSETSLEVMNAMYGDHRDVYGLMQQIRNKEAHMLSGHFEGAKYIPFIGITNAITFVRDPIDRIISEYNHFVRLNNYNESFETFYRSPRFINSQIRHTSKNFPVELYGFVGLTERYNESLRILNAQFGMNIETLHINTAEDSQAYSKLERNDISNTCLDEIKALNKADISLYNRVVRVYETRQQAILQNKPYVHSICRLDKKSNKVFGAMWFAQSHEKVKVTLFHKGKALTERYASNYRKDLLPMAPPRKACVGLEISLSSLGLNAVQKEDLEIRVTSTQQNIHIS